jgi:ubiquinone/menaquinone biosynthesis C-methylase UbiE
LNEQPQLKAKDGSFDAVVCCVSVQYMQYPERVFAEIYRVLKPGGVCIMSFSNRMFYQKAIAVSTIIPFPQRRSPQHSWLHG